LRLDRVDFAEVNILRFGKSRQAHKERDGGVDEAHFGLLEIARGSHRTGVLYGEA